MHLLVVTHDKREASFLKNGLQAECHTVEVVVESDGRTLMAEGFDCDLVILSVNRHADGALELLGHLRAQKASLPVLLLVESSLPEDRIKGLDLGADDCMSKPYSFGELSARVRALLRRRSLPVDQTLCFGDLELNWQCLRVTRAGRKIQLTPKEFSLLAYLMRNAGRPLTRAMILDRVWGLTSDPCTNVVDVCIAYLRRKVDDGFESTVINTVRGVGYRLGEKE